MNTKQAHTPTLDDKPTLHQIAHLAPNVQDYIGGLIIKNDALTARVAELEAALQEAIALIEQHGSALHSREVSRIIRAALAKGEA